VREASGISAFLDRIVQLAIDGRDLLYPAVALEVVHIEHKLRRPVKMIGDIGYLFVEFV
jgi:hypothetical protein